jgi:hypothetical protein
LAFCKHEKSKFKNDVWLTPLEIIRALGEFDLDPCGEKYHPTAKTIFTEKGLEQDWFGRIWLNPPYSEVGKWLDKLKSNIGIALVFARLDTKWAQSILPVVTKIFIPKGRIAFLKGDSTLKQNAGAPSMLLSFNEDTDYSKLNGIVLDVKEVYGQQKTFHI